LSAGCRIAANRTVSVLRQAAGVVDQEVDAAVEAALAGRATGSDLLAAL